MKKVGRVFGDIDNGSDFTVMSKAVGYVLKGFVTSQVDGVDPLG